MPSVSSTTNRQHDHIAHRVKMVMWERGKEWYGGPARGGVTNEAVTSITQKFLPQPWKDFRYTDLTHRQDILHWPPLRNQTQCIIYDSFQRFHDKKSDPISGEGIKWDHATVQNFKCWKHTNLLLKWFCWRFYQLRHKLPRMFIGKGWEWLNNLR